MFVKWCRISAAENKTVISGDAEVCVLKGLSFFHTFVPSQSPAGTQCPENAFCRLTLSNSILQHMKCIFVCLFFSSSLQMIDFLNCSSMLPEPNSHPEAALYHTSNAKLLNCRCGIKETQTLIKHPFMSLEYFPYSTEVPSTSVFSKERKKIRKLTHLIFLLPIYTIWYFKYHLSGPFFFKNKEVLRHKYFPREVRKPMCRTLYFLTVMVY